MFGYIVVNLDELKVKEWNEYKAYYCGLCQSLKHLYGHKGQLSLNYDMTFLALLLTGLYEPQEVRDKVKCIAHPMQYHPIVKNAYTDYAASMNLVLSYYKALDDWEDDHSKKGMLYSRMLTRDIRQIQAQYPRQCEAVSTHLHAICKAEQAQESQIDIMAGHFGNIMEELFVYQEDGWQEELRHLGFYLGKFIYILDAYDDLEQDISKQRYNPFAKVYEASFFESWIRSLLVTCAQEMARVLEVLPIIEHEAILKNIIYSGIWSRYQQAVKRREDGGEHGSV